MQSEALGLQEASAAGRDGRCRPGASALCEQSEDLYRLLVEHGADVLCQTDATGTVCYVSPASREVTGYAPGDYIGRPVFDFIHAGDVEQVRQFHAQVLHSRETLRICCRLCRKDGGFVWAETTARAARDPVTGAVRILNCSARDISERRQLEHSILDISNREKQHFGGMLHDSVGQHLSGLVYLSRALARRLEAAGSAEAGAAAELSRLTLEALTDTRRLAQGLWPVNMEFTGLATALEAMVETTERVFHMPCRVRVTGEAVADPMQALNLYYIAHEAVGNAVRHARATGVEVILEVRQGEGRLEVHDNGQGLPEDRRVGSGGMGLRLMELRAEAMGGALVVHSEEGQGTRVSCRFTVVAGGK